MVTDDGTTTNPTETEVLASLVWLHHVWKRSVTASDDGTTTNPTEAEVLASECSRAEADNLIKNYIFAAAGLSLVPIPLVDLGGLMALQIKMVHGLAMHYGVPFNENIGKSLITSLLSGAVSVIGVMGLSSLAKAIPVLGTLGGGASVAISASAITYAVGQVFAKHFESGGTLHNFNPQKMRDMFKLKINEGKDVAQAMPSGHT
jgi:uncharacterized protein (DUF697 family)